MDTMAITLLLVTLCQSLFPAAGLGRVCSIPAGCQEPPLESVLFNQGKRKVLPQGRSSPRHQDVLGTTRLESRSVEKDLEVLLGASLTVSCQRALGAKRVNVEEHWRRLREVILPLGAVEAAHGALCPAMGSPV